MQLSYLEFDFSEDEEGHGSFDAMASVAPGQLPALQAEIVAVLAWAHGAFGPPTPLEEGGEWDHALQGVRELPLTLRPSYDAQARRLLLEEGESGQARTTLSFTLTGTPGFCAAFRSTFGVG